MQVLHRIRGVGAELIFLQSWMSLRINICDTAVLNPLRQQPSDCWAGGGGGGRPDRKALWAGYTAALTLLTFSSQAGTDRPQTSAAASFSYWLLSRGEVMKSGLGLFLLLCSGVLHAGRWTF